MNHFVFRYLRLRKNLSQAKLADTSGVSIRTIRDIETGANTEPDHDTLALLCKVLCPENPSDFWDVAHDSIDYAREKQILPVIRNRIPFALHPPLARLLNPEMPNTTNYVFACLTGYLHGGSGRESVRNNADWLFPAMAAVVQTSTLTTDAVALERHCHGLICDLRALSAVDAIPHHINVTAKAIAADLESSRIALDPPTLMTSVRSAFYLLFDNWTYVKDYGCAYTSLCNISLLCDNAKDTHDMRTPLFYAICAYVDAVASYRACNM